MSRSSSWNSMLWRFWYYCFNAFRKVLEFRSTFVTFLLGLCAVLLRSYLLIFAPSKLFVILILLCKMKYCFKWESDAYCKIMVKYKYDVSHFIFSDLFFSVCVIIVFPILSCWQLLYKLEDVFDLLVVVISKSNTLDAFGVR